MAVPHIIAESNITAFKFYENGVIHEAILVNNQIMRLAGMFAPDEKQAALKLAYRLCKQFPTVITPNPSRYRVWVDIRCADTLTVGTPLPKMPQQSSSESPVAATEQIAVEDR